MKIRKLVFRILAVIFFSPVALVVVVFLNYQFITFSVRNQIFHDLRMVPFRNYTLIPGSGNYQPERWTNHTLNHRLMAVEELYVNRKTDKIISSGSKKSELNDEAGDMTRYFIENGISEKKLFMDTSATRTWKSVLRTSQQFPGEKIIIVSQKEHLERALFIAKCIGIDAIGYIADPAPHKHRYWTIREYLARFKCTYDCLKYKIIQ